MDQREDDGRDDDGGEPAEAQGEGRQERPAQHELLADGGQDRDDHERDQHVERTRRREGRVDPPEELEGLFRGGEGERLHLHEAEAADPERGAQHDGKAGRSDRNRSSPERGSPVRGAGQQEDEDGERQEQLAEGELGT